MPPQKSFQNSDHLFPESSDIEHTRAWLANTSAKEISDDTLSKQENQRF